MTYCITSLEVEDAKPNSNGFIKLPNTILCIFVIMKQLEKYSSFNELKSSNKPDSFSVEQELKVKELYSLLQRAASSGNSSIQKNPKKT